MGWGEVVSTGTLGKVRGTVRQEEGVESDKQWMRLQNLGSTKETSKTPMCRVEIPEVRKPFTDKGSYQREFRGRGN